MIRNYSHFNMIVFFIILSTYYFICNELLKLPHINKTIFYHFICFLYIEENEKEDIVF